MERTGPHGGDCAIPSIEDQASQAPETIDAQLESPAAAVDKQAADVEKLTHQRKRRTRRSHKRQAISADLDFMVSANRQAGGRGVYAGFRIIRAGGMEASSNDEPYLGAFLPLNVAAKFPWLLAFATVAYEDVFVNEQLNSKTRTVVRPGKFRRYGFVRLITKLKSLCWSSATVVFALIAAAAFVWLVLWIKRWR